MGGEIITGLGQTAAESRFFPLSIHHVVRYIMKALRYLLIRKHVMNITHSLFMHINRKVVCSFSSGLCRSSTENVLIDKITILFRQRGKLPISNFSFSG